jgi:ABC-type polysaccharide/polyol phosphate export permease
MYLLTLWMILVVVILEAPLNPPWRRILGITLIVVMILYCLGFVGILGPSPYVRVR